MPFKLIQSLFILILCLLMVSCNKNPLGEGNGDENGYTPGTSHPSIDEYPAWSPDGNVIVYYRIGTMKVVEGGDYIVEPDSIGLWFVSPTGDNKRQFLEGRNRTPAWSPDGKWIAFVKGAQIYKIKADGDSLTQITFEGRNFFPAWSPNGNWIAYSKSICEGDSTCGIWMTDSGGLNNYFIAEYGMFPTWHPLKNKILYFKRVINKEGKALGDSLWNYEVGSKKNRQLNFLSGENHDNRYPKYSPDGTKIVFMSNGQIWLMDSDDYNLVQLTQKGGNYPAWSHDGKFIVFTRNNYAEFGDENGRLWIMDSNAKNIRQLTFKNK